MHPATRTLFNRLQEAPGGRLPFAEMMRLALYDRECGYYGRGPRRLGRGGDYFTSVSVGPLYAQLLAACARREWLAMERPSPFFIIEQGAHDGQLAADIMAHAGDFAEYCIVESKPEYRLAQAERLGGVLRQVRWVDALEDTPGGAAFFLCNELPDAFPVHLVRLGRDGAWRELWVAAPEDAPAGQPPVFTEGPLSDTRLLEEISRLGAGEPAPAEGAVFEINLAALDWLRGLAAAPFDGPILIADYGYDQLGQAEGPLPAGAPQEAVDFSPLPCPPRLPTLRRYFQHRSDERVLDDLGECDLTAHVNFTRLSAEAEVLGLRVRDYQPQGRFLERSAVDWLRSLDGRLPDAATAALLRQYQTLTHPALMGRSFRVLLLDKAPDKA